MARALFGRRRQPGRVQPGQQTNRFAVFRRTEVDAQGQVKIAARRQAGIMNRDEARYAAYLSSLPDVREWYFEAIKLRLEDGSFLEHDFWVIYMNDYAELHEVKARWGAKIKKGIPGKAHVEDDARQKLLWCAQRYPLPIKIVSWNPIAKAWEAQPVEATRTHDRHVKQEPLSC